MNPILRPLVALALTVACYGLALLVCLALDALRSAARALRMRQAWRRTWGEGVTRTRRQGGWRLIAFAMGLPLAARLACASMLLLSGAAGLTEDLGDGLALGAAALTVAALGAGEARRARRVAAR